jgi:hypothetical protein
MDGGFSYHCFMQTRWKGDGRDRKANNESRMAFSVARAAIEHYDSAVIACAIASNNAQIRPF